MAKAGYCSRCGANAWLDDSGGCINGHGPGCVTGAYDVDTGVAPMPQPVAQPLPSSSSKHLVWLIVLPVVALVSLLICGILAAIAIPVFSASKTDAQRRACLANVRVVEGAAMVYTAEKGAKPPAEWSGLMSVLTPSIMPSEPTCPVGGTYRWVVAADATTGGRAFCSIHGGIQPPE